MWFRVDDSFYDHPKAVGISNDSLATWVRAGDWCSRQLTDGAVPAGMLVTCAGDAADPDAAARDLVDRNLWEEDERGWQFHDWADWNPTRAQVLAKRKKDADRRRDWLAKHTAGRNAVSHDVSSDVSNSVSHGVSSGVIDVLPGQGEVVFRHDEEDHAVSHGVHHTAPDPTRPDPTRKVGVGVGEGAHARTNEGQPDDDDHDDEELNQVQALMAAAGRPVGREDAAKIRDAVIAKGGQVRNRRSFIGKVLGDQRQARGYAPGAGTAPTVKDIIADAHRPGGPSAEVADRAMEARKALANRPRPPGAEARDGDRSPTRGAHFEELAAAQLAEARAARAVIEPGPEPAADPETPDAEPGGEPEAEDADDDEFVPPF